MPDGSKRLRVCAKIVTRRYAYIVYYSLDLDLQEVVVGSIQHPARKREYSDV